MHEFFKFVRSVFSESDGTGSYSRCASFAIVVATLAWVTHVVIKAHAVPDLSGPTTFIAAGAGSQYGLNKLSSIVSSITGKGKDGVPDPPSTPQANA